MLWSPEAGLLNKSSCLPPGLGVTNLQNPEELFWPRFVALFKPDLDVQQTHLWAYCYNTFYVCYLRMFV